MENLEEKSHQLPSHLVSKEFGEINVRHVGDRVEVSFTVLMEPTGKDAEGWRTGVALDASTSMTWAYGRKLEGNIPPSVKFLYEKKGWFSSDKADGVSVKYMKKEAIQDAIERGYLKHSENLMQKLARDFIGYLASGLDAKGKTRVVYWACGDGSSYEEIGEFDAHECKEVSIQGPKKVPFGSGTHLVPVLDHFNRYFESARQTMAIFLTDGRLEDFEAVKSYTVDLAKSIESGQRNPMKCVLIGVGKDISREQMEELDDLDTGTDVDIWDHKIAHEMRTLVEIFAEVVNEHMIVAPTAAIYDSNGNVVKKFSDGMPARVDFTMPSSSDGFELVVGEASIKQTIRTT